MNYNKVRCSRKKKNAYTLVELIVAMFISIIIGTIVLDITIDLIANYYVLIDKDINLNKVDNAVLNIDMLSNSNGILNIEGNKEQYNNWLKDNIAIKCVELKNTNSDSYIEKEKIIFLKGERLYVKTIKETDINTIGKNNILLNGVKDFQVNLKGQLIYYKIIMKDGETRIGCI